MSVFCMFPHLYANQVGVKQITKQPVITRRHNERDGVSNHRLFAQQYVQAQIKENIKAPRHWPLWGEFTGNRWIPHTKGQ